MKNQYLIIFITNIFLIACTTTPKANNYSHTETGRWIASADAKANAKKSAIMFLTDQAISSCEAVDKILRQVEQQQNRQEEVQVSLEDLKQEMLITDAEGNVSLRNPDCKDKIFALAQVVCDGTDDSDPLCEAVRLRRQVDAAMLQLQTADSATVQRTITELTNEIRKQEQLHELSQQQQKDDKTDRKLGVGAGIATGTAALGVGIYRGFMAYLLNRRLLLYPSVSASAGVAAAFGISSTTLVFLGALLLVEAGILAYSLVKAFDRCNNTNIERCRRKYFARTHNSVWTGILQVPAKAVIGLISLFKRDD